MTTAELEKEVARLKIQLSAIVTCLIRHDTLPILGAMNNWENYETLVRQGKEAAGLKD